MDYGGDQQRKVNPKQRANFLSLITFFYTCGLLKKARKKDIAEQDIYQIIPNFRSAKVGEDLERQWVWERTNHQDPSLIRLLWASYGKYYLGLGIVQLFVKTAIVIIQPLAVGKVVAYFADDQTHMTKADAFFYASLLVGLNFLFSTYAHNYMLLITELGMRVRTAFCSLIYRKSLKLSPESLSEITIGRIVTLISKDVQNFETALIFMNDIWIGVVLLLIITYKLYSRVGVAAFAGFGFLVLVIPLQLYIGKLTSSNRIKASKITDKRLQIAQETLSAIKIVKMYTWEKFFSSKISESRSQEINKIKKIYYWKALSFVLGSLVLQITLYIIVMTYTGFGNILTAEVAYFLTSCVQMLRSTVTISIPLGIVQTAELVASCKRINNLLKSKEVQKIPKRNIVVKPHIFLEDVAVHINGTEIIHDINLNVSSGFNFITGRVGGGKSSLLKTILEDYPISSGKLKVQGRISYASEEPWLFPSSIRQNILFGQDYHEERYQQVLDVCALRMDIATFERGDESIVDDRGMNLSKGQQARISLARAVYSESDIYLLDDCLSSLDSTVQDFVFRECIRKFLKNKIILMISHNQSYVKEADNVIIMQNGTIKSCVKPTEIPEEILGDIVLEEEKQDDGDVIDNIDIEDREDEAVESSALLQKPRQNIYHEDKKEGEVDMKIYKQYCRFGGGIYFLGLIILFFGGAQLAVGFTDKLVSQWVNVQQNISNLRAQNLTNEPIYEEKLRSSSYLLYVYSGLVVTSTVLLLIRAYIYFQFSSKASVNLHNSMVTSIINATMQFFDLHYIGNILNRFSKDLGTIDEYLPFVLYECLRLIFTLITIIGLIASVNKYFFIPAGLFFLILIYARRYYLPASRSLKRLDAATRSPVLGHLNASLEGLTTIRAYGTQKILKEEFDKHQDLYTSNYHMMQCSARTFGYILDMMSNVFIAIIVFRLLIFDQDTAAGNVGLAITQAQMLTGVLQWGIRQWAELENQMTSVERVVEYTDIEAEDKDGDLLEDWPKSGEIIYKNVNLTYGKTKEWVLKNLNFTINAGEKVGIVGRTGAGKSSIISTLFRLYQSEGTIFIDGVDTKTLALDFLRSSIAIIPQDPVLFLGSIRSNIDPVGRCSDEEIWQAVEIVNLKKVVSNLDYKITESGSNFSSGQRQLICLARAIVSKSKIIILDEATANMDPEMEGLIHLTIQQNFAKCTVLTIAHRLHSVLGSDRVMVVDKGEIVEFDAPEILLENHEGVFYKMVKRANLLR